MPSCRQSQLGVSLRIMGRPLTPSEAAAALRRGGEIEQFLNLADGQITYLTASQSEGGYTVNRHVVLDEGTEQFQDLSEFSPVDDEEYVGEGILMAQVSDPAEAVSAAMNHGGSPEAWVNFGMASDSYWTAKTQRG